MLSDNIACFVCFFALQIYEKHRYVILFQSIILYRTHVKLAEHGIGCEGKTARQMTRQDYAYYDYVIAMDHYNLHNLKRMFGEDTEHKISLLMDYTHRPGDVADPWYTGDFEATWVDVLEGCKGLLSYLRKQ